MNPSYEQQSGVALITALTVVALATITAVAMTERQQLDIRRTGNLLFSDQAYVYALGGEKWAQGMLVRDILDDKSGNKTDSLNETWAAPLPPTEIEGGSIQVSLRDAQAKFNLNNLALVAEPDPTQQQVINRELAYFTRLLQVLEIETDIAQAVADWIDDDINARFPGGAEDLEYLNREPPYRTPNRRIADVSELRLIKGVTEEIYRQLAPYVTALPESTPLNINTADAVLIRAIGENVVESMVQNLIEERVEKPFSSTKEFINALEAKQDKQQKLPADREQLISINSRHFLSTAIVKIDRFQVSLTSIIRKEANDTTSILARRQGGD